MVARWLNSQDVPAPKGGSQWRDATVRTIARNHVYISPGNAVHEPLVGRRMFNAAQRALDKRTSVLSRFLAISRIMLAVYKAV
jgi:hypothetical protein